MTSEIRGYLLGGCQLSEGLEINGGIFPCGQATQSSQNVSVCASQQYTSILHINTQHLPDTTSTILQVSLDIIQIGSLAQIIF